MPLRREDQQALVAVRGLLKEHLGLRGYGSSSQTINSHLRSCAGRVIRRMSPEEKQSLREGGVKPGWMDGAFFTAVLNGDIGEPVKQ
eukprot:7714300-Prorocentrum_lima.AAC.1